VFERFTERARQVVVLAQEEARNLTHDYIGTEHLLLGLSRQKEGLAARVLESHGVTVERVRAEVVRLVGPGEDAGSGQIPFTPRAKKVLQMALDAALSHGHNHIGTEHILVALLGEDDGVSMRILLNLDVDPGKLRDEVAGMLSAPDPGNVWVPREGFGSPRSSRPPLPRNTSYQGVDRLLDRVEADIREALGREPDVGDLLLVLATVPDTLAFNALRERGVDPDALWATIERLRRAGAQDADGLKRQIEQAERAKEQAIEAGDFERAATLRDQERDLRQQASRRAIPPDALNEIRRRLGIPSSRGD
jgi:ATP-dependent Clp protease ATP-binding subunit ClpA